MTCPTPKTQTLCFLDAASMGSHPRSPPSEPRTTGGFALDLKSLEFLYKQTSELNPGLNPRKGLGERGREPIFPNYEAK